MEERYSKVGKERGSRGRGGGGGKETCTETGIHTGTSCISHLSVHLYNYRYCRDDLVGGCRMMDDGWDIVGLRWVDCWPVIDRCMAGLIDGLI